LNEHKLFENPKTLNTKEKESRKIIQGRKILQTVLTDSTAELKDVVLLNKTKVPHNSLLSHRIADSKVSSHYTLQ